MARGPLSDLLRLVARAAALSVGSLFLVVAIVLFVPDGNDYARVTLKKHARLEQQAPKKTSKPSALAAALGLWPTTKPEGAPTVQKPSIVFVGGSNLAYGLDSARIERATGHHVVNMGMNGFFGIRFMLEEIKPYLKPNDVVMLSFEYDNFFKSEDGTSEDLLLLVKNRQRSIQYLSWKQRLSVTKAFPYVAQQKILRAIRERTHVFKGAAPSPINDIETFAGFNDHGDLTSHLGVAWPLEVVDGLDITSVAMNHRAVRLMQDFAKQMSTRGIRVIVSYSAAADYYYAQHEDRIEALHEALTKAAPLVVPSHPTDFVFPRSSFFNTVYHMNAEGRELRTREVLEDLEQLQIHSRYQ